MKNERLNTLKALNNRLAKNGIKIRVKVDKVQIWENEELIKEFNSYEKAFDYAGKLIQFFR